MSECSGKLFWVQDDSVFTKPAWLEDFAITVLPESEFLTFNLISRVFSTKSSTEKTSTICQVERDQCQQGKSGLIQKNLQYLLNPFLLLCTVRCAGEPPGSAPGISTPWDRSVGDQFGMKVS